MGSWTTDQREGYKTKVIETPHGRVTVHRPILDDQARRQRETDVQRALAGFIEGGKKA